MSRIVLQFLRGGRGRNMERLRSDRGTFVCKGEPATEPVRSRFQKSLYDAFKKAVAAAGISQSEFIRIAVEEKLERDGQS